MQINEWPVVKGTMIAETLKKHPDLWVDFMFNGDGSCITVRFLDKARKVSDAVKTFSISMDCSAHDALKEFHRRVR